MSNPITVDCPTCGAPVEWGPQSQNRPFCSERCKLIDLGAWAAEEHAIPGDDQENGLLSGELPPREH
jgi:hypothetical protein